MRKLFLLPLGVLGALAALSAPARAGVPVKVTVTGTVDFNGISSGPLAGVSGGDAATMTFSIDSATFVDSSNFPTRGYVIAQDSFTLTLGGVPVGLQKPFPAGSTPYFVLRNDDPGVDGFFVATSVDFPIGVPTDQTGVFGQFLDNFSVTYGMTTLSSLDVLGALGHYDFTGLTVFNWTLDDGPFNAMGLSFTDMTIECDVPAVVYCTGKVNTQGCTPFVTTDPGTASQSNAPWNVTASNLLNSKPGLMFYGFGQANLPFQGGTLCVQPPLKRGVVQSSGGSAPPAVDCTGQMVIDIASETAITAPTTVYVQAWSRDPASSFGTSLSNAAQVFVCP